LLRKSIWDWPADISGRRLLRDIQVSCQIVAGENRREISTLMGAPDETARRVASILHCTLNI